MSFNSSELLIRKAHMRLPLMSILPTLFPNAFIKRMATPHAVFRDDAASTVHTRLFNEIVIIIKIPNMITCNFQVPSYLQAHNVKLFLIYYIIQIISTVTKTFHVIWQHCYHDCCEEFIIIHFGLENLPLLHHHVLSCNTCETLRLPAKYPDSLP